MQAEGGDFFLPVLAPVDHEEQVSRTRAASRDCTRGGFIGAFLFSGSWRSRHSIAWGVGSRKPPKAYGEPGTFDLRTPRRNDFQAFPPGLPMSI